MEYYQLDIEDVLTIYELEEKALTLMEKGVDLISHLKSDKERMGSISDKILESVKYCDEIIEVFEKIKIIYYWRLKYE